MTEKKTKTQTYFEAEFEKFWLDFREGLDDDERDSCEAYDNAEAGFTAGLAAAHRFYAAAEKSRSMR